MKKKIVILIMVALLLTGCAKNSTAESTSTTESEITEATESSIKSSAESGKTSAEQTETSTEEAEETVPYVLTFESVDTNGEKVTSDMFADSKLTMLNIWATYCEPCLREMPDLGEIASEYDKADFQILGVISDVATYDEQEAIDEAVTYIEGTGADTYTHVLLSESLYYNIVGGVDSVPTTVFINQKGEVLGYIEGAQSKDAWISIIEILLAEYVE